MKENSKKDIVCSDLWFEENNNKSVCNLFTEADPAYVEDKTIKTKQ